MRWRRRWDARPSFCYYANFLTPAFTKTIAAANCDGIAVPSGFEGGAALDFASAFWCFSVYHLTVSFR